MIKTMLGTKGSMGQTFVEGTRVPYTRIKVGPCVVTQIKSTEKDGYWGIQLGFALKKLQRSSKALQGHLAKSTKNSKLIAKNKTLRYLREIRMSSEPEVKVGDEIAADEVFKRGDEVTVTGISKGKGFAGVVKRWHFAGGPKTHGQSDRQRAPGSIGLGTTPGRVFKGKKMAGRMGTDTVTISNLIIVEVDKKSGEILVSGPVPGNTKGLLIVKKTASGKLAELISETPQVQVHEGEGDAEEPQADNAQDKKEEVGVEDKNEKENDNG